MGVVVPNFASSTEDRASGAHEIQGSLTTQGNVNGSPFYMSRTPGSAGNRRTFTWSCWFKRTGQMATDERFLSVDDSSGEQAAIKFINNTEIQFFDRQSSTFQFNFYSLAHYRDPGAWYHMVAAVDTTQATTVDRVHIYINGEEIAYDPSYDDYPTQNHDTRYNNTTQHNLFAGENFTNQNLFSYVSQIYWIDGQQLDPTYFGFTDPLTNTWRPKAFNISDTPSGSWGTCGYYLPMDGSAPIGEDQSGQGNHWESNNGGRGGSGALDIATGAFPILNTKSGGKVETPAVRGQAGIAVTVYDDGGGNKFYLDGVKTGDVNVIPGQRLTFDTSSSTLGSHPFRLSGVSNGLHNSMYGVSFDGSNDTLTLSDNADFNFGSGDFTIEAWVKGDDTTQQSYTTVISQWQGGGTRSWMIRWSSDDIEREAWSFFYSVDGTNYGQSGNSGGTIAGTPLDDQKWHHIAVARSGGTIRCYTDGILNGTKTTTDTFADGSANIVIGSDQGGQYFDGVISDLRVTKGEALYTGSGFVPPSAPMTTTSQGATASNVKLLCCNGAAVTDSTVTPGTITNSGSTSSNDNPYDYYVYGTVTQISDGSAGAATTITIPHNAPTNLYYFCTAHSGMGGSATIGIGSADNNVADPYAWKNIYSSSFSKDKKNNALTATVNPSDTGSPTIQSTAGAQGDSHFYGSNLYLDGNDALNLGTINGTDLEFGGHDWCIEFWVNSNTTLDASYWNPILSMPWHGNDNNYSQIWIGYAGGASGTYQTGELHCRLNAMVSGSLTKTELDTNNSKVYDDKMWHHVAVTKEHKIARIYLDGELKEAASIGKAMNTDLQSQTGWIGAYNNNGSTSGGAPTSYMTGYLNDFRIYKGIAKYTQDRFIPASSEPTIVDDSPSGVSYSSALDKPTNGCVDFDGSGDYISQTVTTVLSRFATQAFTAEYWVKADAFSSSAAGGSTVLGVTTPTSSPEDWSFGPIGGGEVKFYYWNGGAVTLASGFTLLLDKWYHLALVHDGSDNLTIFVDGKIVKTGTVSGTPTGTSSSLSVGQVSNAAFNGKVSNLRITHSAVYTGQFTPSTKPLTNITNTKLLCCQSTTSAIAAAVTVNTFSASGNAKADPESPLDIGIDFVQGKASGYCVLNSRDQKSGTIVEQLKYNNTGTANVSGTLAMPRNSGKYYYETYCVTSGGGVVGIGAFSCSNIGNLADMKKLYGYSPNGKWYENDTGAAYGATWTNGDTVSILFDTDTRQITFWKNGSSQGLADTVDDGYDYFPQVHCNDMDLIFNFGQNPFKFQPPAGYKTINTENLPVSIVRPDDHVGVTTYAGNGGTNRNISDLNFAPDLVWVKRRDAAGYHILTNTVIGASNYLVTNTADASSSGGSQLINGFNPDGFKIGNENAVNNGSGHYVAWGWKAGGKENTFNVDGVGYASASAAGLSGATIDPTAASVNTEAGFSILKFEAPSSGSATIKHGMGRKPAFWMYKPIDNTTDWYMYHQSMGASAWMNINTNSAPTTGNSAAWGGTEPTTTVLTHGSGLVNQDTCLIFAWADVPGLQKFGFYYGNGNADGPFVNLGFRPAIIWYKDRTSGGYWNIRDDRRTPINGTGQELYTATDELENYHPDNFGYDPRQIDFYSNGFKILSSHDAINNSSRQYIYMCWSDAAQYNLYGGQSNAR